MKTNLGHRSSWRLRWVPRWSVFPTYRKQTVAEHVYGVMILARWLLDYHVSGGYEEFRYVVLDECLIHDRDEGVFGDAPSPTKKKKSIEHMPQSYIVLKVADCLEAYIWQMEELKMGNQFYAQEMLNDLTRRTQPYWDAFEWGGDSEKPNLDELLYNATGFLERRDTTKVTAHPIIEWMDGEPPF